MRVGVRGARGGEPSIRVIWGAHAAQIRMLTQPFAAGAFVGGSP